MVMAADIIDVTGAWTAEGGATEGAIAAEGVIEQMRAQGLEAAWESANPDYTWGRRLRDQIEDGLAQLAVERNFSVTASSLRSVHGCEEAHVAREPFEWNTATAGRQLLPAAYDLLLAGTEGNDAQLLGAALDERAEEPWSLGEYLSGLGPEERHAVTGEVLDEFGAARALIGRLPLAWKVRVAPDRAAKLRTLGPDVKVRAKAHLVLGPVKAPAVVILRHHLNPGVRDDLRFYALVQTINANLAPATVVGVGIEDGAVTAEPVTLALLEHAAGRVVDGVLRMAELIRGAEPVLRPGPVCGWCPRRRACPSAGRSRTRNEAEIVRR